MATLATALDEEAALEQLHEQNLTDGLPVVVPTRNRVATLVQAGGLDEDMVLGFVGPSQHDATVEAVAINAVMAGCTPEHFPVVLAAIQAICDEHFDLTEVQVTTHPVTPLILVNGPARAQCGLVSGAGAFGPGHRANASIGRAVRLVMMNIGGGRPDIADMSVFGSPAKFAFCAAENEEESPWEPLHVSRGWKRDQSTVTVAAVEGPHSVACAPVPDDLLQYEPDFRIAAIASAIGSLGSNTTYFKSGTICVILNPQISSMFAKAGFTRGSLQQVLTEQSRHTRDELRKVNPGLVDDGPAQERGPERDPSTLLVAVAGGGGHYAMVCPSLGVGPHQGAIVTKEIAINQVCEVPLQKK